MKTIIKSSVLTAAALSFVACGGGGANSNSTANSNTVKVNSNTAVVVNTSNTMSSNTTNSMMNSNSNTNKSVSSADTDFMNKAAQGGMTEIKASELASTKGQSAEVKKFGQQMIEDHTKAGNELKSIAANKSVTLPTDVNAEQKAVYDKLSKLSGAEFDKEYVKAMTTDHEKTVADFEKQSSGGTDTDVKGFATKNLPTIKEHLEMIKGISAKMK